MKCPKCNQEIDNDSLFCDYCGEKITHTPTEKKQSEEKKSSTKQKKNGMIIGAAIAVAVIAIVIAILLPRNGKSDATEESESSLIADNNGKTLYPISDGNDKWGYMDNTGKVVIVPKYAEASLFNEGLAKVLTINGKLGFIDPNDKMVITFSPEVDWAGDFHEGLAIVKIENKYDTSNYYRYGYIDKNGNYVIEPQFEYAMDFHEGLACVRVNGMYGYIDKNGVWVINPQYEEAGNFHEGLACVKMYGQYGYIDRSGNWVVNPQFSQAGDFHDGRAGFRYSYDGFCGYIDKAGNVVIEPQYEGARDFSEGLARFYYNGMFGFIDINGNWVIPPKYGKESKDFSNGITAVIESDIVSIIDRSGNTIKEMRFDEDADLEVVNGMIYVRWSEDGYRSVNNAWVDKTGKIVYSWTQYRNEKYDEPKN